MQDIGLMLAVRAAAAATAPLALGGIFMCV